MDVVSILITLAIGAVAGWITSFIMNTKGGLIRNIIVGILGGFVGSYLCKLLNISFAGYLGTILVSVVGACLLVFVINKIFK